MFTQLALFLVQTATAFWVALYLFRWYCLLVKLNLAQGSAPLAQFVYRLTDWSVLPIRRVLPRVSRFDLACFMSALMVHLLGEILQHLITYGHVSLMHAVVASFFELAKMILNGGTVLLVVYALLSWLSQNSETLFFIEKLTQPLLRTIRKNIPPMAGIDLSVFFALVLIQMSLIVLAHARNAVFSLVS